MPPLAAGCCADAAVVPTRMGRSTLDSSPQGTIQTRTSCRQVGERHRYSEGHGAEAGDQSVHSVLGLTEIYLSLAASITAASSRIWARVYELFIIIVVVLL